MLFRSRSSAVLESAPTTTATSPTLENGSDDKQLKEILTESRSTHVTPVVAEAFAVPISHEEPHAVDEELKPVAKKKRAEKEKDAQVVRSQDEVLREAPPGAFPLDVVTPGPTVEDNDVSLGATLFSNTTGDASVIDAAADVPVPPTPAPLPHVLMSLHEELDDVSEGDDFQHAFSTPAANKDSEVKKL